jgi:hypothetical protein
MELDIETLQQIVAMLPPEWQRHIATIALCIPLLSLLLVPAKWAVAKWVTSPQLRAWFDALFNVLDLVAINTRGMDLRPLAEPKPKKEKR